MIDPNASLLILLTMICALFVQPKAMMTITASAALAMVVINGAKAFEGVAHHLATVLLVMSATQLAVHRILEAGAEARMNSALASLVSNRFFRRVPTAMLLPALFIPATTILASVLHNVTAIMITVPLLIRIAKSLSTDPRIALCALLIASNLGGASTAFGDGPAIMQRQAWGFSPAVFAAEMTPRNAILLLLLTLAAVGLTWWPVRKQLPDWEETYRRLRILGQIGREGSHKGATDYRPAAFAALVLFTFIGLQFVFPTHGLELAALAMAILLFLTPEDERPDALVVLGIEPIIVITSLFVVAASAQQTPIFQSLAAMATQPGMGRVELVSYLMTLGISADGAAAALVHPLYAGTKGSLLAAWKLAGGICAGSSVLLTSASAGPILYALCKRNGLEISFRRYAAFGVPFSIVMIVVSIVYNAWFGGAQ